MVKKNTWITCVFLVGIIFSYSQETKITRISANSCANERTLYLAENAEADYFEWTVLSQASEFKNVIGEVDTLGTKHDTISVEWLLESVYTDMILMSGVFVKAYKGGTKIDSAFFYTEDISTSPTPLPELNIATPTDTIACGKYTELFKYKIKTGENASYDISMQPENAGEITEKTLFDGLDILMYDPYKYIRIDWDPNYSGSVQIEINVENNCGSDTKTFKLHKLANNEYNKVETLSIDTETKEECVKIDYNTANYQTYVITDSSNFTKADFQIGDFQMDVEPISSFNVVLDGNDTIAAQSKYYILWTDFFGNAKFGDSIYVKALTPVGCNAPVSNYIRNFDYADSLLVKFCEEEILSSANIESSSDRFFPNPISQGQTLSFHGNLIETTHVSILDMISGKVLFRDSTKSNITIPENIESGIYLIVFETTDGEILLQDKIKVN